MAKSARRSSAIGGARDAVASASGGTQSESWSGQHGPQRGEGVSGPRATPVCGACENLVCLLKVLANQQCSG